jgi:hypothetical protein
MNFRQIHVSFGHALNKFRSLILYRSENSFTLYMNNYENKIGKQ